MKNIILATSILALNTMVYADEWNISGDFRERYQYFDNLDFDSSVNNNSWELDSRLYLKAKKEFDNGLSIFLQPQAVYILNHTQATGNTNLSQLDFLQAYIQHHIGDTTITLGRQQLIYGDQRLLGHLGWKDVARTFDGIKASYQKDAIKVDAFAVHPADIVRMTPSLTKTSGDSLVTWSHRSLLGIYATYTTQPKTGLDAYFINWRHSSNANVAPNRNINTYGVRGFGVWDKVDATVEAVFQSGTWISGVSQSASAYAFKAGYTLDRWNTRLGIEYDYSPGDDKTDASTQQNFVFPYHTNHAHYGEMDRFSWANMKDIRLSIKTSPSKTFTFIGNIHFLSLDKATGDWLNVVGTGTLYAGNLGYTQTDAGTEVDLKVIYQVPSVKGLKIVGNYSVFNPGDAVKERNGGKADTASFAYVVAQYAF